MWFDIFATAVDVVDSWAPWIQWQFATGFDEVNQTLASYFKAQIPTQSKEEK